MTIDEYCKSVDFPLMKIYGKMNGFIWYIEKDPPERATGVPIMIRENVKLNKFEILNSDQVFAAMDLFRKG